MQMKSSDCVYLNIRISAVMLKQCWTSQFSVVKVSRLRYY